METWVVVSIARRAKQSVCARRCWKKNVLEKDTVLRGLSSETADDGGKLSLGDVLGFWDWIDKAGLNQRTEYANV